MIGRSRMARGSSFEFLPRRGETGRFFGVFLESVVDADSDNLGLDSESFSLTAPGDLPFRDGDRVRGTDKRLWVVRGVEREGPSKVLSLKAA